MPEKTMVTIDCDLIIPEGTEKIFENQHITLDAGIRCNGKLIFRDCKIEPVATQSVSKGNRRACKPGCIEVSGAMQMEGCEVIRPGRGFLSGQITAIQNTSLTVQNTSFLLVPPYDAIISGFGEAQFEGCSFVEEAESTQQTTIGKMIPLGIAIMKNCTFNNISGRIDVDTISGCSFTGCASIESVDIADSTFTDCKSITANSGCFRNCDFIHVEDVSALSSDVDSCRFQNIENDKEDEGVIFLDDSKMMNCTFDGVDLRNGSYLVRSVGDSSVENCQFANCYTEREDRELFHYEAEEGSSASVPMGLLKGALKLAGSAALATAGIAATLAREAGNATGIEILADVAGTVQDASFEKIRDMWSMDGTKKVDGMSMDELDAYLNRLTESMDSEEYAAFLEEIDSIDKDGLTDAEYEAQLKEIVKATAKARGAAKRAEQRAASASRSAEQFRQRYEKEKENYNK